MQSDAEVVIVGAGLAGACAALTLSPHYRVLVLEASAPASGASGAAAGLVNPFMGRRARRVWRAKDALQAVTRVLERAGAADLFPSTGVLRPVVEPEQSTLFQEVAKTNPDLATWVPSSTVQSKYPFLRLDRGALYVPEGGAVDIGSMVRALLEAAKTNGARVEANTPVLYWRETPDAAFVEVERDEGTQELRADRVLLALGQGYPTFPELRRLGLSGVKGQTVRIRRPHDLEKSVPPMSGRGYIVPDGDTLVLGSNYDNNFDTLDPDPDATEYIRQKTAKMIREVYETEVLEVIAGVRVKYSETNRPLLGPLPDRDRIWTFTALGSKGLLTAPLLSLDLPSFFDDPTTIPNGIRPPD